MRQCSRHHVLLALGSPFAENLGMSRSTIYRRISQFRAVFGEHPDVYDFPGVDVDVDVFLQDFTMKYGQRHVKQGDQDDTVVS